MVWILRFRVENLLLKRESRSLPFDKVRRSFANDGLATGMDRVYITQFVLKVVLQKSTPPQI